MGFISCSRQIAFALLLTSGSLADVQAAEQDRITPRFFKKKMTMPDYWRPFVGYSAGYSSARTNTGQLFQGPQGGLSYSLDNDGWIFMADATGSLSLGLSSGIAPGVAAGVMGGRYAEFINRDIMLGIEARHYLTESLGTTGAIRLGAQPRPGSGNRFGGEIQYTQFTRIRSARRYTYPTTALVMKWLF